MNVSHNKQGFAGQSLRAGAPSAWRSVSLWAGQTHIPHLPGKVPPSFTAVAVKPLALWKGGSSGRLCLGRQRYSLCFGHSLCSSWSPVTSCQMPAFPMGQSTFCLLRIGFPSSLPPWSGLVLSPMMFQDGGEVRNVPDPTNMKHIPAEIPGHVCSRGISPDSAGQVHPEKLSTSISSQGWGGSG